MPKWITNRRPTKEDADPEGFVWRWSPFRNRATICPYRYVFDGEVWQPIVPPEPFKPTCADCGQQIGKDAGPPDGWQLQDGRTVCQACCVKDTKKQCKNL